MGTGVVLWTQESQGGAAIARFVSRSAVDVLKWTEDWVERVGEGGIGPQDSLPNHRRPDCGWGVFTVVTPPIPFLVTNFVYLLGINRR